MTKKSWIPTIFSDCRQTPRIFSKGFFGGKNILNFNNFMKLLILR